MIRILVKPYTHDIAETLHLYEAFSIHVHLLSSKPEGNPGSLNEEVRNDVCTVWKYRGQPDATVVLRPCLTDMCEITIMGSDDEWKITNAVTGMLHRDFRDDIRSLEIWFGI
jgi:hypothetical protein